MRPLSEMLKRMLNTQLRDPERAHSPAAVQVGLYLANLAWNESLGICHPRESYRNVWETIEPDNPDLWNEFVSTDTSQMIDEMVAYKNRHFPNDKRRILTCGIVDEKIRVEWLPPANAHVDSEWELRMYGLIRIGKRKQAIRLMQETRRLSRPEATQAVDRMAMRLGMIPSLS